MKLKFNSLRARILLIFVVLTIILFSSVRFTQQYVNDVTQSSLEVISEEQQLAQTLKITKTGLRSAERIIYQYSLSPDHTKIRKINNIVKNAHFHINTLLNNPTTQNNGLFRQPVLSLQQKLNNLSTQLSLIETSADTESKQTLLKETIHPVLTQAWQTIEQIDARLDNIMTENVLASVEATDTLYSFIWLYTSFTFLILFVGYFVFEFAVRRPLMLFSNAMEAYGSDASSIPNLKFKTEETSSLLKSFNNMKTQVDSRQRYLESILDNAGEGIITVNNNKTIETFNSAAKKLFGYTSEEVVGKEIFMLFPGSDNEKNKNYYQNLFESGADQPLPEINATIDARRKNAMQFPLSIKTTNLELEGKHISIAIVDDVSERESMMKNLRKMAEHDALTGLYNRQYFMEELERNVAKISRSAIINCALLYIDLDNFKFVNDTLGHLAGDRVLVEVSAMINQHMSKNDIIARIGGDEFGILLNNVNSRQALKTAEHYRKQFTSYIFKYGGKEIDIGCSIGIALFDRDSTEPESLVMKADLAMCKAKAEGCNRVQFFIEEILEQTDQHQKIEDSLRTAIENDELYICYQPLVQGDGSIAGAEALVRWSDSENGLINPSAFIPIAERTDLICALGYWVLNEVCKQVAAWGAQGKQLVVSVNISPREFQQDDFVEKVQGIILNSGVRAEYLVFELTERVLLNDIERVRNTMQRLSYLGIRFALDDFGTGYSSLQSLKQLPLNTLKIDRSFVHQITAEADDAAVVSTIIAMAGTLGIDVVAEGVEKQGELDYLLKCGCKLFQGYYFSRPVKAKRMGSLIPVASPNQLGKEDLISIDEFRFDD